MPNPAAPPRRSSQAARIVLAAAIVAVLDLSFAATWWVVVRQAISFERLLQSIASSVLGAAAFQGGAAAAWVGLALHAAVATSWTVIFAVGVRRWPLIRTALARPGGAMRVAIPYGMAIWLIMNFIVVPLSRHGGAVPVTAAWFWGCLLWHPIGVALPIVAIVGSGASGATRRVAGDQRSRLAAG